MIQDREQRALLLVVGLIAENLQVCYRVRIKQHVTTLSKGCEVLRSLEHRFQVELGQVLKQTS